MNYEEGMKGSIEVIVGPMFAGKTEELIRRIRRMDYAHKKYVVFKPLIDNRYSMNEVVSHNKRAVCAIPVSGVSEMIEHIKPDTQAIVIDEVQFFSEEVIKFISDLADSGHRVICGGLDMDFRGEPFGIIGPILAIAESVTKLTAICTICGKEATRTQRIIGEKLAYYDDPIILVGEKESYEARCRCHHVVLYKDEN